MVSVKRRREKALPEAKQQQLLDDYWEYQAHHICTKENVMSWITGAKHATKRKAQQFSEYSSDDIAPFIKDIKIPAMSVEVAPTTKKVHGHVFLEIKHTAYIELDVEAIQTTMINELPKHLSPKTGKPYVWVKNVSAAMHYTLSYINKGNGTDDEGEDQFKEITAQLSTNGKKTTTTTENLEDDF